MTAPNPSVCLKGGNKARKENYNIVIFGIWYSLVTFVDFFVPDLSSQSRVGVGVFDP